MKKRLLSIAFVAAMAATAGWNFTQSENNVNLSDLALENVEALANTEMGSGTCFGAGAGGTNVTCYGGSTICCWAHTNIFGKN